MKVISKISAMTVSNLTFRNSLVPYGEEWFPTAKPAQVWGPSLVGCLWLLIQYIMSYPDARRLSPLSATWTRAILCPQGPASNCSNDFTVWNPGVHEKGIQNKKIISRKLTVIHVSGLCHRKGKRWNFFFISGLRVCGATFLPPCYASLGQRDGWEMDRQRWINRLAS
jgi:hypothetical protein